jgi:hypothetical protein
MLTKEKQETLLDYGKFFVELATDLDLIKERLSELERKEISSTRVYS